MPTQNVSLTETLDRFVKEEVASGHFNNASEVHRAALAAMAREKEERQLKLEKLRQEIELGISQAEAREVVAVTDADGLKNLLKGCHSRAMDRLDASNAENA